MPEKNKNDINEDLNPGPVKAKTVRFTKEKLVKVVKEKAVKEKAVKEKAVKEKVVKKK